MKKVKEIKAKPNPITRNDLFASITTTYVLKTNTRRRKEKEHKLRYKKKKKAKQNENYVARCIHSTVMD